MNNISVLEMNKKLFNFLSYLKCTNADKKIIVYYLKKKIRVEFFDCLNNGTFLKNNYFSWS